jgi:hypothetical protein
LHARRVVNCVGAVGCDAGVQVSARVHFGLKVSLQGLIQAKLGGVSASASWTKGIEYNGDKLLPYASKEFAFKTTGPSLSVQASGDITSTVYIDTKISIVGAKIVTLPVILTLAPSMASICVAHYVAPSTVETLSPSLLPSPPLACACQWHNTPYTLAQSLHCYLFRWFETETALRVQPVHRSIQRAGAANVPPGLHLKASTHLDGLVGHVDGGGP